MSLASLSFGGLGEAAADDVAVLPEAMAFLETVCGPGGLAAVITASLFGAAGAGTGVGTEGVARTGSTGAWANLFVVGEAGTDGGCSPWCNLCCCW